ncbi:hypothetical protein ACH5RR_033476 [Cinchona calisaya]|uniref:F-box domain-containing protein n=1 Tax=Cinchona calisaya TaxID=153742 RepID=A0ABD2YL23_9GENT
MKKRATAAVNQNKSWPFTSPENSTMETREMATRSDFAPAAPPSAAVLPQELITQILLYLPAKSIGRFRCVSKPWNSLLSSSYFIKSHLSLHSIHSPPNLIIVSSSDDSLFTITFTPKSSSRMSREDGVSRKLKNCQGMWDSLLGSCNGLVLILDCKNCLFLMNPTTLELVKVPDFSLALDTSASFSIHGFGYDSSSDDYKIVKLSCYDKRRVVVNKGTFVDVYSLKMKTWRRIENSPCDHSYPHGMHSGVLLNGAIHWLATDTSVEGSPDIVAAFGLSDEKFKHFGVPSCFNKRKSSAYKLAVVEGCLGMVCDVAYDTYQYYIWIMKEYGVQESWTKLRVNLPQNAQFFEPICQFGDEEVVFLMNGAKLVLNKLMERSSRNMVVSGVRPMDYFRIMTFCESLVSPSFRS